MLGLETVLDGAWWGWMVAATLVGMVRSGSPGDGTMETDAEMIAAVRQGDATAYRGLVEKYQGRVYNVIYGMVRNREDARDLTQEVFVKAYRNLGSYREDARFYTWVYRIAMNLAIDFTRRRNRSPVSGLEEDVAQREVDGTISDVHHAENPRRTLERKQLYKQIMDALETLPEQQKQVILLRELEGLSYKEIAEVLDIAEGTVMSRLFYARRRLQKMLSGDREAP